MLLALSADVRAFLRPHWRVWHERWGPPAPALPSQWTCVRSSLLLVRALARRGVDATLRSGRPGEGTIDAMGDDYGVLTADGWAGHAWVEAAGFIIDITADQFGYPPVRLTPVDDPTYRKADLERNQLTPTPAGVAAIEDIWPAWCSHADQRPS